MGSVADGVPGVHSSQLMQTGPRTIVLRLDVEAAGISAEQVWQQAHANLTEYFIAQGLSDIEIIHAAEAPERSTTSGKFRQVIAAPARR